MRSLRQKVYFSGRKLLFTMDHDDDAERPLVGAHVRPEGGRGNSKISVQPVSLPEKFMQLAVTTQIVDSVYAVAPHVANRIGNDG